MLQKAPKDKLLVYSVKEGWGPLCEFLDIPVPDTEFPHKNKGASLVEEYMKTHPMLIRMQREMMVTSAGIVALLACLVYNVATNSWEDSFLALPRRGFELIANCFAYKRV